MQQDDQRHGGTPPYPTFPPQASQTRSSDAAVALGAIGTAVSLFIGPVAVYVSCLITGEWFWTLSAGTFVYGFAGLILGILALKANSKHGSFGSTTRGRTLGIVSIVGGSIGITMFLFFAMIILTMWAI